MIRKIKNGPRWLKISAVGLVLIIATAAYAAVPPVIFYKAVQMRDTLTVDGATTLTGAVTFAGAVTGANAEEFENSTNGTWTFTNDSTTPMILMCADSASPANCQLDTTGAGTMTIGSADVTANILISDADTQLQGGATGNVDLTFHDYADTADDDQAHGLIRVNCTDATTGAEDCDLSLAVAEAGAAVDVRLLIDADDGMDYGSATTANHTFTVTTTNDASFAAPATSISAAEMVLDTIDYAQITDTPTMDATTTVTMGDAIEYGLSATYTATDAAVLTISLAQVDDAVATDDHYAIDITLASESDDAGDTIQGISITGEDGTANTIFDFGLLIDNEEATAATMTDAILVMSSGVDLGVTDALDVSAAFINNAVNFGGNTMLADTIGELHNASTGSVGWNFRDYADAADDDMVHGAIVVNLTDATTGAEDADLSLSVAEAGAAPEVRLAIDGDGSVSIGGATNDAVILLPDVDVQIQNQASGNVTLDFRDYADSADDDMAHVIQTANCTDAATGTEDCDFTVGVVEAGAAAETRFHIDADGGIIIGSANNNTVTLTTSTTGNAAVVAPAKSIQSAEFGGLTNAYRFCGQGANGSTTSFVGPVPIGSNGADYTTGAAGCDALDNTTEATADGPPDAFGYTVNGMICSIADGGTDDTYTFQLRDDAADVTGVTCAVVLNGAGTDVCSISDVSVVVAAGSAVAVSQTGDDDNCSACDTECLVFVTYDG